MNQDEISKLQATLEGAYPTSKISPSKVFDLWRVKRELLDFPNTRRADLVNRVLEVCKEFPSLPQLLACMRDVAPPEKAATQTCLICDDTGWIHYDEHGELFTRTRPGYTYNGKPIEYPVPRPCPAH